MTRIHAHAYLYLKYSTIFLPCKYCLNVLFSYILLYKYGFLRYNTYIKMF